MKALLPLLAGATLLLAGCSGSDSSCSGAPKVALADVQKAVFTPSCATSYCHSGSAPAEGLSLEAGKAHDAVVGKDSKLSPGVKLVAAGSPADSEVYREIQSGLMPQGKDKLPSDQQKLVHDWICAGAPAE